MKKNSIFIIIAFFAGVGSVFLLIFLSIFFGDIFSSKVICKDGSPSESIRLCPEFEVITQEIVFSKLRVEIINQTGSFVRDVEIIPDTDHRSSNSTNFRFGHGLYVKVDQKFPSTYNLTFSNCENGNYYQSTSPAKGYGSGWIKMSIDDINGDVDDICELIYTDVSNSENEDQVFVSISNIKEK